MILKSVSTVILICIKQNKRSVNSYKVWFKFDSRKVFIILHILYSFVKFVFSFFVLYSLQYIDLSNVLLRSFDIFYLCFADHGTAGTYNFLPLIVKIISLDLAPSLSLPHVAKMQYLIHLRFNSTLQLINNIPCYHQKLLRYFNGTSIATFSRIISAPAMFPINIVIYLKT